MSQKSPSQQSTLDKATGSGSNKAVTSKPEHDSKSGVENKPGNNSGAGETGGRDGPDPTRYGDWEKDGRCIDF